MIRSISADRLSFLLQSRWIVPDLLLDELARDSHFAEFWRTNVGVQQSFTLRAHTLRVMDCYEKHFAQLPGLSARERGCFRIFLALHDIGKPLAIEAGDKRRQHRFTVEQLRRTRRAYPVTDAEFGEWIALVDGDPLGAYLKGDVSARDTGAQIRQMASRAALPFEKFCRRLMIYYQCDVSAYTRRGGLTGALDDLFEWDDGNEICFDRERGLLVFAPRVRSLLAGLGPDDFKIERVS